MKGTYRFRKKVFYSISLCMLAIQLNAQSQWQGLGVNWSYWTQNPIMYRQWQNSLYKYQNTLADKSLKQSYIVKKIFEEVNNNPRFETYLFPELKEQKVKIYKFEPKFRMPVYKRIEYQSGNYQQEKLDAYQHFVNSKVYSSAYQDVFSRRYFITDIMKDYAFKHPDKVHLSWDSIPDAPKIGRDGFLQRRSALDGISMLLQGNSYETQPNLEKIVFTAGPWTFNGTENIMLSQGHVSNWVKGGESSVSLGSDLRLTANYKKGKHEWDNYIIHKVGIVSTEQERGRVNTDLIEINTKYGHKASERWYYSFLYNFKTQFFYGYDNDSEDPVSGFLAPAYMSFAVGMDYKPNSKFTLLLSPITSRLTWVANTDKFDETKYGIPSGKSSLVVNGISVVNNLAYELSRDIKISSRLDAFYQYLGKPQEDEERQVQIDWEVIADMKINRFLSTRVIAHLRYFSNESEKVQFRENFNITFGYSF